VVFCDLVGSTALGERLDSETLREVMDRYFTEMKRIVERHGGVVEKYIGDADMAVFGLPRAHEDDTLQSDASGGGEAPPHWGNSTLRSTGSRTQSPMAT
jgi:class 3 adenylate cyclase